MRILFATNHAYLPQMSGGSESSTHDLCCELKNIGCDVAVLSSIFDRGLLYYRNRILSKIGKYKFVGDYKLGYPVYRGWNVKSGVKEVIERFRPDVAVVQAGCPFELVNRFSGLEFPVVLYVRDIEFQNNNEELRITPYVGFIANSTFTADRLRNIYGVESVVLPPLIDPQKYLVSERGNAVVHIGIDPRKGIEISYEIAKRRPDIPFIFIESWPLSEEEYSAYKARADELGNVIIMRRSTDMKKFYRMARILLAPSVGEEAWGRVVTEAQLSGIPVIASNRGGLPESVGMGGLIVPHDASMDDWTQVLSSVWDDEQNYLKLSAAAVRRSNDEKISKDYLLEKFVGHLENHIALTCNPAIIGRAER